MQHSIQFLFPLISLFALSANNAWACGGHNADHEKAYHKKTEQKSCCAKDGAVSSDENNATDQQAGCPCDEGGKDCHCPGCGLICHPGAALAFDITEFSQPISLQNNSLKKQAFYFAQHMPEDVYLSIWQPPKIKA